MTQHSDSLVGSTLADRYEVIKDIDVGSMGVVYEARHTVLGRRLAIKVLKQDCSEPRFKERFFNEARAAGAINHPNIVQVYDFGLAPSGEPYIVMEYVDGETLESYLRRKAPLPQEDAVDICAQVLSALDVIHGLGLVHRDIKPSNIMLLQDSQPSLFIKLVDFGIAKAIQGQWDWPTLTRVDEVLGTPVYLSPEQASGGKADPRWDLWAVTIILYELLVGDLPFPTNSLIQISDDIINHRFAPLEKRRGDVAPWLLAITQKAMHRDMDARFQSAADYLQALQRKSLRPTERRSNTPEDLQEEAELPSPGPTGTLPLGAGPAEQAQASQPELLVVSKKKDTVDSLVPPEEETKTTVWDAPQEMVVPPAPPTLRAPSVPGLSLPTSGQSPLPAAKRSWPEPTSWKAPARKRGVSITRQLQRALSRPGWVIPLLALVTLGAVAGIIFFLLSHTK